MGTHPIFESDFDCLTECVRFWLDGHLATITALATPVTVTNFTQMKSYQPITAPSWVSAVSGSRGAGSTPRQSRSAPSPATSSTATATPHASSPLVLAVASSCSSPPSSGTSSPTRRPSTTALSSTTGNFTQLVTVQPPE